MSDDDVALLRICGEDNGHRRVEGEIGETRSLGQITMCTICQNEEKPYSTDQGVSPGEAGLRLTIYAICFDLEGCCSSEAQDDDQREQVVGSTCLNLVWLMIGSSGEIAIVHYKS